MTDEIPADWLCATHKRHLSYYEWKAGQCFWCKPPSKPNWPTHGLDGKPLPAAMARQKIIDGLKEGG